MWQVTLIRLPYFLAHIAVFIILLACAKIQEGVFCCRRALFDAILPCARYPLGCCLSCLDGIGVYLVADCFALKGPPWRISTAVTF